MALAQSGVVPYLNRCPTSLKPGRAALSPVLDWVFLWLVPYLPYCPTYLETSLSDALIAPSPPPTPFFTSLLTLGRVGRVIRREGSCSLVFWAALPLPYLPKGGAMR